MSKKPDFILNARLIVKPIKSQDETVKSGIVIPKTANADLSQGTVIKIDAEIADYVSVGDTVIFPAKSGQGQLIDGDPHLWLELRELWGGFKPNAGE
jgi:co-chaperonin GroES (HSP10)